MSTAVLLGSAEPHSASARPQKPAVPRRPTGGGAVVYNKLNSKDETATALTSPTSEPLNGGGSGARGSTNETPIKAAAASSEITSL